MAFVWKKTIDSKSEEITAAILTAEDEKEEEEEPAVEEALPCGVLCGVRRTDQFCESLHSI